jgi:hypothetical protein
MAIDYCVDYACEAKAMLGTAGLLQLVQARVAYDATQRAPAGRRGEHDFWTRVVRGPEKDHVEMVTVGNLRRKSNRLIEFTIGCDGCPANVRGGPAGCFGRVTYPIDAPTEQHLAQGAAAAAAAPVGSPARGFVEWITDGPVDGRRVRRMREAARNGVRFFELLQAVPVRVPQGAATGTAPATGAPVTSDHVIEMMFFAFPNGADGFHFTVPRAALGGHRAFLDFVLRELDLGHRHEALARSTTFEQLRLYARAVAIAEHLHVDLLVD